MSNLDDIQQIIDYIHLIRAIFIKLDGTKNITARDKAWDKLVEFEVQMEKMSK